jgi:hypothetical protein
MNIWTQKSIELANQSNYLDLLYKIYPMSVNLRRELSVQTVNHIKSYYSQNDFDKLINILLKQEIFPIKDSYVAYLKKDNSAIARNPSTVQRLSGILKEMGIEEIINKSSTPKETNRQIGPLFKRWISQQNLGVPVFDNASSFLSYDGNSVLNSSDANMQLFAKEQLGYINNKGLDFVAKFNQQFIIAEAKFLTDFGGHQNAQFNDAINTMTSKPLNPKFAVKSISILDGVLYIKGNNKMYKTICNNFSNDDVIISAVLLRDYLFSI